MPGETTYRCKEYGGGGGEKRYENGLFALGVSYNPPILPLSCCFSAPWSQFIIFPPSLSLCSSFVSSPFPRARRCIRISLAIEKRKGRGEGEGGIVAKVRYRCRRDTGVARITVTAAPGGWKRPPLARSFAPFRCLERHATSRRPSSLWIPFRTRAKVWKKIGGFRKDEDK